MKPDQKIALFLTFITGAFAGGALYLTVFAPEYKADPVEEKSALSVTGEMYGGCSRGGACPSFRLAGDRTYFYSVGSERSEGTLPSSIASEIYDNLTEYRLAAHSAIVEKDDCMSAVDGIDYYYEVSLGGKRYVLDTCETSLSYGSDLQQSFLTAWQFMASPTSTYPEVIEKGLLPWLIDSVWNKPN